MSIFLPVVDRQTVIGASKLLPAPDLSEQRKGSLNWIFV